MRLWHIDVLPFLPRSQLLAQWRELNSIFAKEDKHVLINYIYEYDKRELKTYTDCVLAQMRSRGYTIRTFDKMERYFDGVEAASGKPYAKHHNDDYLRICYYNLYEKYIRGQKDYEDALFQQLHAYVTARGAL